MLECLILTGDLISEMIELPPRSLSPCPHRKVKCHDLSSEGGAGKEQQLLYILVLTLMTL